MIKKLERMVITTKNINKCIEFYEILGFEAKVNEGNFYLEAEDVKIALNLLEVPNQEVILPLNIQTGCESLVFEVTESIDDVMKELMDNNIKIEGGIILREGLNGTMKSIIVKDPDENIIELASYK